MTHVQKIWTAAEVYPRLSEELSPSDVETLKLWCKDNHNIPTGITDEQLIIFLHSNYNHLDNTKKCMEEYYKLFRKAPQLFQDRDIKKHLTSLQVLQYGIFRDRTPKGYKIIFHSLKDNEPSKYFYNDGFKLLSMAMESVYIREGPHPGIILLFDFKGVKLGHVARLPLMSIKRSLEFIQEANPVRLKGIHVLNVNAIIDKIMVLIRPFLKKQFLSILHFHKEGDQSVYDEIPKRCFPSDFDGEQDNLGKMQDDYIQEMENLRSLFLEEEAFLSKNQRKSKNTEQDIDIGRLEID